MKEYKCIKICKEGYQTEEELNKLAKENWEVICSYSDNGYWLILEKDLSGF